MNDNLFIHVDDDKYEYINFFHITHNILLPWLLILKNNMGLLSAVLKYMAKEGCERQEAQGNMDAFFENPNGTYIHINIYKHCF